MGLKKRVSSRRKVLLTWLASYCLVLLIPVLIGVFVYARAVQVVTHQVGETQRQSLLRFKTLIDGRFEEIGRLDSLLSTNQYLRELSYEGVHDPAKDIMRIYEAQKDLASYSLSNSFVSTFYIYINRGSLLFSNDYKFSTDEVAGLCASTLGITSDQLTELTHESQIRTILVGTTTAGTKRLLFVQSLYYLDYQNPYGAVIALVDGSVLDKLFSTLGTTSQTSAFLVDDGNRFVGVAPFQTLPDYAGLSALRSSDPTFVRKLDSGDATITHVASDVSDIEYVSLTPSAVYLKPVQNLKNLIFLSLGLCLLLGIAASWLLAVRNYGPVRKLMQMLLARSGGAPDAQTDEFKYMESSLKNLMDQNSEFLTTLRQQQTAFRYHALVRVLRGRVQPARAIQTVLAPHDILLEGERYAVLLFRIVASEDAVFKEDSEIDLVNYLVTNLAAELIDERYHAFSCQIDGMAACIVEIRASAEDEPGDRIDAELGRIAVATLAFMETRFDVSLEAGISAIRNGPEGIAPAYGDALDALEYGILVEEPSRIVHAELLHPKSALHLGKQFNLEKERQFINAIKSEDFRSAESILEDMLSKDLRNMPIDLIRVKMFGLMNSLFNAMGEIRYELDIGFLTALNPVERLLGAKTISSLNRQIVEIFDRIVGYYEEKEHRELPSWVRNVEEYVGTHYAQPDLSIAEIADHFGLSISYLSRSFKKRKGVNLLDHIHAVRLEAAKAAMDRGLNLRETAAEVGYLDDKALIRAFKRYEGTTPGRFREAR